MTNNNGNETETEETTIEDDYFGADASTKQFVAVGRFYGMQQYTVPIGGDTPEEARRLLLECVGDDEDDEYCGMTVFANIGSRCFIPVSAADKMPRQIPDGFGLLILQTCCHSSGSIGEHRFFAVPIGQHQTGRLNSWSGEGKLDIAIPIAVEAPKLVSFLNSNSEYHFPLPLGSMEWVGEAWRLTERAEYRY